MLLKDKKILIVDDEVDIRDVLVERFQIAGCQAMPAHDAANAEDVVKEFKPDLVISDIRMGRTNGIELLKKIRSLDAFKPAFLFVSGYPNISIDEAYDLGAEGMYTKPVKFDVLLNAVQNALTPLEVRLQGMIQKVAIRKQIGMVSAKAALGRGGFFVEADTSQVVVGGPVEFKIRPEAGILPPLEGCGYVRWLRDFQVDLLRPGFAVEIETLTPKSAEGVLAFIEKNKPKAYIPKTA